MSKLINKQKIIKIYTFCRTENHVIAWYNTKKTVTLPQPKKKKEYRSSYIQAQAKPKPNQTNRRIISLVPELVGKLNRSWEKPKKNITRQTNTHSHTFSLFCPKPKKPEEDQALSQSIYADSLIKTQIGKNWVLVLWYFFGFEGF